MNNRFPSAKSSAWRDRFVAIAREVERGRAPRSLVIAAGLKARARLAASGSLRHARLAA